MSAKPCAVAGCPKAARTRGWCPTHYARWLRRGTLAATRNYSGRRIGGKGYVLVRSPGHPLARQDGYVPEHRKVVHDAGITIPDGWHVHHINGDKTDNRLENLEVIDPCEHGRLSAEERWRPGSGTSSEPVARAYAEAQPSTGTRTLAR